MCTNSLSAKFTRGTYLLVKEGNVFNGVCDSVQWEDRGRVHPVQVLSERCKVPQPRGPNPP